MDEPQIIKTPAGDELVVLTRQDYDNLLHELAEAKEDLADIATYDECMADLAASKAPYLPAEVSPYLLKGHSRVSAFRHWRGLSLGDLAKATAIDEATLASIEARAQTPTPEQVTRLATTLDIPTIWIEP
jgi:Helix-turn-helix domain